AYRTTTDGGKTWSKWNQKTTFDKDTKQGTFTIDTTDMTTDSLQYQVTVVDQAENKKNSETSEKIKVDTQSPENVSATLPENIKTGENEWNQAFEVTVNGTDPTELGNIIRYEYLLIVDGTEGSWQEATEGKFTVNESGKVTFKVRAVDQAENKTESEVYGPYNVDTTAPVNVNATLPENLSDSWNDTFNVTINAEDQESGIAKYEYLLIVNGQPQTDTEGNPLWQTAENGEFPVNVNGNVTFKVRATNNAGLTTTETTTDAEGNVIDKEYGPFNVDTEEITEVTASVEEGVKTGENEWNQAFEVTINATAGASGISSYEYLLIVDGTEGNWTEAVDGKFEVNTNGKISFKVRATTGAGKTTEGKETYGTYNVDTTAPVNVSATLPELSDNWNNKFNVTINAEDNESGITKYEYLLMIDGTPVAEGWQEATEGKFEVNTTGNISFQVRATNASGLTTTSEITYGPVKVDTTAPTKVTASVEEGVTTEEGKWNQAFEVTINAEDKESGISSYEYLLIVNGTEGEWTEATDGKFTVNADGEVTFKVRATNGVGLTTTETVETVEGTTEDKIYGPYKVDTTKPTYVTSTLSGDQANGWYKGNITVTVDVHDQDANGNEGSGVYRIAYRTTTDGGKTWSKWNQKTTFDKDTKQGTFTID
uniref:hypothetical protein n=1 Tax=Xylanibacter rodentium TaxID=2736289 RepID=UPI00259CBF24